MLKHGIVGWGQQVTQEKEQAVLAHEVASSSFMWVVSIVTP